jgi:predicted transposase/invertase (TIGR01784 family)
LQEGIEQGMQQEKAEIAKNMLNKGYQTDAIRELIGLSQEELEKLQKEASKN